MLKASQSNLKIANLTGVKIRLGLVCKVCLLGHPAGPWQAHAARAPRAAHAAQPSPPDHSIQSPGCTCPTPSSCGATAGKLANYGPEAGRQAADTHAGNETLSESEPKAPVLLLFPVT